MQLAGPIQQEPQILIGQMRVREAALGEGTQPSDEEPLRQSQRGQQVVVRPSLEVPGHRGPNGQRAPDEDEGAWEGLGKQAKSSLGPDKDS